MLNVIDFEGTSRKKWARPDLEEWGFGSQWDSLSNSQKLEVADNFLFNNDSKFPPENFGDLKLPVVEPVSELLNKHALDNADARLNQTEGISNDEMKNLREQIGSLQVKRFNEDLR